MATRVPVSTDDVQARIARSLAGTANAIPAQQVPATPLPGQRGHRPLPYAVDLIAAVTPDGQLRLAFVNELVRAGYEVHVNLSPVVAYDGWLDDWAALCDEIDAALSPDAKAQLAAEVIFLTHNAQLHEVNLGWHPQAEALLWTPEWQEEKRSQQGGVNVRYRTGLKGQLVRQLLAVLAERLPYCRVRYAF